MTEPKNVRVRQVFEGPNARSVETSDYRTIWQNSNQARIIIALQQAGIDEKEAFKMTHIYDTFLPVPVKIEAMLSYYPNFRRGSFMKFYGSKSRYMMMYDKGQRLKLADRSPRINFYFAGNDDDQAMVISEAAELLVVHRDKIWKEVPNHDHE